VTDVASGQGSKSRWCWKVNRCRGLLNVWQSSVQLTRDCPGCLLIYKHRKCQTTNFFIVFFLRINNLLSVRFFYKPTIRCSRSSEVEIYTIKGQWLTSLKQNIYIIFIIQAHLLLFVLVGFLCTQTLWVCHIMIHICCQLRSSKMYYVVAFFNWNAFDQIYVLRMMHHFTGSTRRGQCSLQATFQNTWSIVHIPVFLRPRWLRFIPMKRGVVVRYCARHPLHHFCAIITTSTG